MTNPMQPTTPERIGPVVSVAIVARIALNTARRFVYPFAPALSRGLGVPVSAITSIIALTQGTGLLGLFLGPLTDHLGYRFMMMLALSLLVGGLLAGGIFPVYLVVMSAIMLAGLGKTMFDPAIQAYIGAHVPYHRRGFAIGLIEVGWAGSSLVGIPVMGLLIERAGWRAPFFALALVGALSLIGLRLLIPRERLLIPGKAAHSVGPAVRFDVWKNWRQLLQNRTAWGTVCCGFLVNAANDVLFVVYGSWLESAFGLSAVALGLSVTVIGVAELAGEGFTAFLADRIGLHRAIMIGVGLSGVSYLFLMLSSGSLPVALAAVFLIFVAVEFTIVSSLSFSTELLPQSRATMLAGYLAAASAGRVVGALLGGLIWSFGGITATACVSAGLSGVGLAVFWWGLVRNRPPSDQSSVVVK